MAMYKKMSKGMKKKSKKSTFQQRLKKAGLVDESNMTVAEKQKLITKRAKQSAKEMDMKIAMLGEDRLSPRQQQKMQQQASAKYAQQAQATNRKRKTYNLEIGRKKKKKKY
jgi:hypothetical protein